jgi:EAL domain-containing protein (putative c-di-GMP-specific phosphodiesterase class I)
MLYSFQLTLLFLFIDFILLIITGTFSVKNLVVVRDLEDYFINKSYGTNALRVLQFHKLMDENLFDYYFQPIINARTGEIFAYEALMRTDPDITGMLPEEILDFAAKENRLYEIEKYTCFNILKIMQENQDIFKTRKLFINSISSHQLTEEDYGKLYSEYSPLFENIVMEITESTKLDEVNLRLIHNRIKNSNCQLALDDYGTGYSNESNLLNLSPNYVKIDRTILRYINIDPKKQHLVFNLVNFAKQNHIKIIAEGIENYEEFEYVINLGVDYIQGYYAAKPDPVPIDVIPEDTVSKIQKINIKKQCSCFSEKSFETDTERLILPEVIASDQYTSIVINEKELILQGEKGTETEISLIIPDNHKCRLILDNLSLINNEKPTISIGKNCNVELVLKGDNFINENGIRVPESSDLIITGDGNLTIATEEANRICLGGSSTQSYGNITLASMGNINLICHGNIAVAMGGGQNSTNSVIHLVSGNISVEALGHRSLGIGCMSGNSKIIIEDCTLKVSTQGTKSVCIGSIAGYVDIVTYGNITIKCDGKNAVCMGTLEGGDGSIAIRGGSLNFSLNANTGSGIGSVYGSLNIDIYNGDIHIYGEGGKLVGIGDHIKEGSIRIRNGILFIQLYATDIRLTGCQPGRLIIDGGNIQCDFTEDQVPVNSYGTALSSHIITDTDEFKQNIETVTYSYEYRASFSSRYPYIKVYLPENTLLKTF